VRKKPWVQREKNASGRDQGPRAGARQLPGGGGARSERTRATRTGDPRRGSRRGSTGEPARREAWPEARRAERAEEGWGPPAGRRAGAPVRPLLPSSPRKRRRACGAHCARRLRGPRSRRAGDGGPGAAAERPEGPRRGPAASERRPRAEARPRRVPKSKKKAAGRDGQGFMGERPRLVAALGAEARGFFPPTNGLGNCKRPPVGGELLGREGGHHSLRPAAWEIVARQICRRRGGLSPSGGSLSGRWGCPKGGGKKRRPRLTRRSRQTRSRAGFGRRQAGWIRGLASRGLARPHRGSAGLRP